MEPHVERLQGGKPEAGSVSQQHQDDIVINVKKASMGENARLFWIH